MKTDETSQNKKIVQDAFDNWIQRRGSIFDLLAADATWKILGRHELSREYRKNEFLTSIIQPFMERFATLPSQKVKSITAEENRVHISFSVEGVLKDGTQYRNDLSWLFRMKNQKVVEVEALLDLEEFARALNSD